MAIDVKSKFAGCVVGGAIGDALGWPVEFSSMDSIRRTYGPAGVADLRMTTINATEYAAEFTDDTQMSMAVMRGLIKAGPTTIHEMAGFVSDEFVRWHKFPEDGHRSPGGACMSGCRRLEEGGLWHSTGGLTSGGCGSVMRSHPYGLFCDDPDDAAYVAAMHSKMTHGDPLALASCAALATGVNLAIREVPPPDIADAMIRAAYAYDMRTAQMLRYARHCAYRPRNNDPQETAAHVLDVFRGWAGHEAVAASLYCFLRFPTDYKSATCLAVNSPGDSDSLGAITGALVGANIGLDALPAEWVEKIEKRDRLIAMAHTLHQRSGRADKLYKLETIHGNARS